MNLRWREHEGLLVAALVFLVVGQYCWRMVLAAYEHGYPAFLPPADAYMHDFLPNAGPVLLLYFCYLWANRRIVPGGHPMAGETPTATTFSGRAWAFLK